MMRVLPGVLLALLAMAAVASWFWRDMEQQMTRPMNLAQEAVLEIAPGTTLRALGRDLQRRGWLEQPIYFELEARRSQRAGRIRAGEYAVQPGTTPRRLLDLLVSGQVIQHQLTIIEGWSFRELMQAVSGNPVLRHTLSGAANGWIMATIGHAGFLPEGRFLPDTYLFPAHTSDVEFLQRAFVAMEVVLDKEWQGRDPDLPYASPYQALIMASLVEKETAVPEERSRIAGAFIRRLQKGMRLQTDPTIIYALGESFDGNIRRRDLELDSPFNTYLVAGLPPTPIAMPGRAAIHAALHPDAGTALYFVARGDGTHEFSATLQEHNEAVRKYQLHAGAGGQ